MISNNCIATVAIYEQKDLDLMCDITLLVKQLFDA